MKTVLFVLFFAFCSVTLSFQQDKVREFSTFLAHYNKHYEGAEFSRRFAIFEQAKLKISVLNAEARIQGYDTKFGLTKFADLTKDEFRTQYLGYKKSSFQIQTAAATQNLAAPLPTSLDWRTKGAVTPIKDQQQCDLVGPFRLLKESKVHGFWPRRSFLYSLHNKLSPAIKTMMDAMVVTCPPLSVMYNKLVLRLILIILTLLEMEIQELVLTILVK